MKSPSNLITFLSDFGYQDYFVGAVKGEILKINSEARIIDISHGIEPFDIKVASYLIESYFLNYPRNTIHLAVVDPTVGGRDPVIIICKQHLMVGPDNGLFDPIMISYETERYVITEDRNISATFHARDLFGPTAAKLSVGIDPSELGKKVPRVIDKSEDTPQIIHIDRFGNLITNIKGENSGYIKLKDKKIPIVEKYTDSEKGKLLCIVGSSGRIEISIREGNAAKFLGVNKGDHIVYLDR